MEQETYEDAQWKNYLKKAEVLVGTKDKGDDGTILLDKQGAFSLYINGENKHFTECIIDERDASAVYEDIANMYGEILEKEGVKFHDCTLLNGSRTRFTDGRRVSCEGLPVSQFFSFRKTLISYLN